LGLGASDYARPLAAAGTTTAATFSGAGGFAAYGADRTVNLGGAAATIQWAAADTGFNGQTLILGAASATHTVDLVNPLDLGTAAREDGSLKRIIERSFGREDSRRPQTPAFARLANRRRDCGFVTWTDVEPLRLGAANRDAVSVRVVTGAPSDTVNRFTPRSAAVNVHL